MLQLQNANQPQTVHQKKLYRTHEMVLPVISKHLEVGCTTMHFSAFSGATKDNNTQSKGSEVVHLSVLPIVSSIHNVRSATGGSRRIEDQP